MVSYKEDSGGNVADTDWTYAAGTEAVFCKGESMENYRIRPAAEQDAKAIADIYNSNEKFLHTHLGCGSVGEKFIIREMAEMEAAGFHSCVITGGPKDSVVGVIDYNPDEPVYLSLIMIHASLRGQGMGAAVYQSFEDGMRKADRKSIRIDVVDDYPGSLAAFWQKQGFIVDGEVTLEWGEKRSHALVMRKFLKG